MSRVLVSGATGFIGRALVERLRSKGIEVAAIDSSLGDIAEEKTLESFAHNDLVHMFHLAARTFVPDSWQYPHSFLKTNVLGTSNALEFCRKHEIPMTYVSAYVYGHTATLPVAESSDVRPSNPYALTKWLGENLCEFYFDIFGLPITVVRPFNVFGPRQAGHFLIPMIIEQVLGMSPEILVKDLLPKRDYVYLDDLVNALVATMGLPKGYRTFNVGSGVSLSVQQVIDVIQTVACTNKKIISTDDKRNNEIYDVVADISNAKEVLSWVPEYSFRDGIEKIMKFERSNDHHERA